MQKLIGLALALLTISACQASPSFAGFPTPAAAAPATPTAVTLPPPSATMLGTYMLTLDDVPAGYAAAEGAEAFSLEEAFADQPGLQPAASASVSFRLEKLDALALLTRPAIMSQTVMWYHTTALARSAYLLVQRSAQQAMATEWGTGALEQVPVKGVGEEVHAYRATQSAGAVSGVAYMVLARKGPFVIVLVMLGSGTGVTDSAATDLARTAVAALPG